MPSICRPVWPSKSALVPKALGAACIAVAAVAGAAETRTVTIESMQFTPVVLTVRQGDTVVWINRDLVPHTATAARMFDSGEIAAGRSWKMVAKTKGRYEYVCTMHPTMKATLVVE